ncbi:MAG: DUF1028 domain-containing protein [Rhodocyclaceae bacterium]|nr:DUF1028 domain-containing protein [Rhodocyclaceae bacterium]MCA3088761.1 DUF1028 domain-containing protein [Rhodocyclaceae bacterium]MCA3092455.1 DUF1028 domain-containing protein [Rhodocyclaceae bacterium]MCA3097287.1 DUF1028 domain-containing protein [Rhodocyclaceae bacterium]MCA3102350.1 DUF1028 domain-containing protein [Rhodocyclaceae bacterium]
MLIASLSTPACVPRSYLLAQGFPAAAALAHIAGSDPCIEFRQICVIDRDGNAVAGTGANNKVWCGHAPQTGRDGQLPDRRADRAGDGGAMGGHRRAGENEWMEKQGKLYIL